MSRIAIARAGAFVATGFLLASAVANFMFGISLGRTRPEGMLIGIVGVFAVAMNALAPFFISWSLAASRKTTAASIIGLWSLCLMYSTTSALRRRTEKALRYRVRSRMMGMKTHAANFLISRIGAKTPGQRIVRDSRPKLMTLAGG